MDRSQIEALLNEVQAKRTTVPDALERLKDMPFEDLGFAKLDHHRALRTGMPEVIFAVWKDLRPGCADFHAYGQGRRQRAGHASFAGVLRSGQQIQPGAAYHETARAITLEQAKPTRRAGNHLRGLCRDQRFARRRRGCSHDAAHGQHHWN